MVRPHVQDPEVMVLLASVHPLRFGALPMDPGMISCADGSVHNEVLDEALDSRISSY